MAGLIHSFPQGLGTIIPEKTNRSGGSFERCGYIRLGQNTEPHAVFDTPSDVRHEPSQ